MNTALLEEILSCPSLPSLPAIAVRVVEITKDPNASMQELASLIRNDQGLAAKILRTVNSSFYGLRRQCASIEKALILLGLGPVKSLALGFSLVDALGQDNDGFDYRTYWRRALYTAVSGRIIAHHVSPGFEEEAFVAGLFEDIGMLALHRSIPERYAAVLKKAEGNHAALVQHEIADLETHHAEVGAMLAQRWRLPDEIVIPIRYHERPTAAPLECATLCRFVALANLMHDALTHDDSAACMRRLYNKSKAWFGLSTQDVDNLLAPAAAAAKEISSILRINTGPAADANAILKAAQTQLVTLASQSASAGKASDFAGLTTEPDRLDPLTGLLTRAAFRDVLDCAFETAQDGDPVSLVHVRLQDLNEIKALHTLECADQAVITTAVIIKKHFGDLGAAICRWSEDTFAVVLVGPGRSATAKAASEFLTDLQHASVPGTDTIELKTSIGMAAVDPGTFDIFGHPDRLANASLAAAEASLQAGGNCVRTFVPKAAA